MTTAYAKQMGIDYQTFRAEVVDGFAMVQRCVGVIRSCGLHCRLPPFVIFRMTCVSEYNKLMQVSQPTPAARSTLNPDAETDAERLERAEEAKKWRDLMKMRRTPEMKTRISNHHLLFFADGIFDYRYIL